MKRGYREYLTADQVALVEQAFREGRGPKSLAAELGCRARSISARYRKLRGDGVPRVRKPKSALHAKPQQVDRPQPTEQERRASRFYHSNFEL
jgi:hypothetical protein